MAWTSPLLAGHSGIPLWNRELVTYPERDARRMHLLLVVLITVTLYYELYVGSGVATIMLAQLRMPFPIFVYILARETCSGRSRRCWRGSLTGSDAPILWCTACWWWG
jgi:hypothetical protein